MIRQLTMLMNFVKNENDDLLQASLPAIDIEGIAEKLLQAKNDSDIGYSLSEAIEMLLKISQYIETDTDMESILMDDVYDQLHEKYIDLTGHSIIGTNGTSNNKRPTGQHRYPELRGSLDKVHFLYDADIPKNDSRKSLESWLRNAYKKLYAAGLFKNGIEKFYDTYTVASWFKYDGLSAVFEISGGKLDRVLTRKDTDTNTGVDITHIFRNAQLRNLFRSGDNFNEDVLSESIYNIIEKDKPNIGIQTEILMTHKNFEKFCKVVSKPPKNHRSAATMICNCLEEEYDPELFEYLTVEPLHIISEVELTFIDSRCYSEWMGPMMIDGKYHYYRTTDMEFGYDEEPPHTLDEFVKAVLESLENNINWMHTYHVNGGDIPIDGVVITLWHDDEIEILGRSDNKNKFQVAYKFIAGEAKTMVKNVSFPVGPVTGLITPLLEVEPIKIMGNTISNATLSNIDKFERLNLHVGDEIIIKYNIVPTVFKDDTCKVSNNPLIEFPKTCPTCGEELSVTVHEESGNRTVRCINNDCPSKVCGKIFNYINKIGMDGIGLSTIEDFVTAGIIKTIPDLYRLETYRDTIVNMRGYGINKFNIIMKAIYGKLKLYPHELLGSIGIPDVGRRIMERICTELSFSEILELKDGLMDKLCKINGIGEKMAIKICDGIYHNKEMIDEILHYVTIKEYDNNYTMSVLFSNVRDKEFEELLKTKYHAKILDGYNKNVDLLIVEDVNGNSTKIQKAKKDGKKIISIQEARSTFK